MPQNQPSVEEREAEQAVRDYQMVQEQLRSSAMQLNQLQNQKLRQKMIALSFKRPMMH